MIASVTMLTRVSGFADLEVEECGCSWRGGGVIAVAFA